MKTENTEMSFGELIVKFGNFISFLFKRWVLVFSFCIAGSLIGLVFSFLSDRQYEAHSTFVLCSENKSGGLIGLASQFGFDIGAGGGDAFSDENIVTLFKSVFLGERVLFKKPKGFKETLLNIYCNTEEINKGWSRNKRFKTVYPFPDEPSKMTPLQDSMFREIHNTLVQKAFDVIKPDKKTSIYHVNTKSKSEIFALYFTNYLINETSSYYIETKTKLAKQNLDMLMKEADSLRNILSQSISNTANAQDRVFNLNPAMQFKRSPVQQGSAQTTVLGAAYGEVVKNLEIAKITLQKETPLFQIVDEPRLPLKSKKFRKIYGIIIGGMLGFLGCCVYFSVNSILQKKKQRKKNEALFTNASVSELQ